MKINRNHLSKRRRSQLSERELAKAVGGKVQPASGALPVASLKGDVKSDTFLFDDKTTLAKSFSVNMETFRKLRKEAWQNKRRPAIRINFENGPTLYVIEEQDFLKLL